MRTNARMLETFPWLASTLTRQSHCGINTPRGKDLRDETTGSLVGRRGLVHTPGQAVTG